MARGLIIVKKNVEFRVIAKGVPKRWKVLDKEIVYRVTLYSRGGHANAFSSGIWIFAQSHWAWHDRILISKAFSI